MNLLLDTHVWIWASQEPDQLGKTTRKLLKDQGNDLFLSPVSTLEIARLVSTGRISLRGDLLDWVTESIDALACGTADLTHEVATEAYRLPGLFHPDPADRILAATARLNTLSLLTADRRILDYPHIESVDARL